MNYGNPSRHQRDRTSRWVTSNILTHMSSQDPPIHRTSSWVEDQAVTVYESGPSANRTARQVPDQAQAQAQVSWDGHPYGYPNTDASLDGSVAPSVSGPRMLRILPPRAPLMILPPRAPLMILPPGAPLMILPPPVPPPSPPPSPIFSPPPTPPATPPPRVARPNIAQRYVHTPPASENASASSALYPVGHGVEYMSVITTETSRPGVEYISVIRADPPRQQQSRRRSHGRW